MSEKDITIAPGMMAKIQHMSGCDKAVLLGEDPEVIPNEDQFRKALRKMLPLTEKAVDDFLEMAAEHDLRFTQAWHIYQRLTFEKS